MAPSGLTYTQMREWNMARNKILLQPLRDDIWNELEEIGVSKKKPAPRKRGQAPTNDEVGGRRGSPRCLRDGGRVHTAVAGPDANAGPPTPIPTLPPSLPPPRPSRTRRPPTQHSHRPRLCPAPTVTHPTPATQHSHRPRLCPCPDRHAPDAADPAPTPPSQTPTFSPETQLTPTPTQPVPTLEPKLAPKPSKRKAQGQRKGKADDGPMANAGTSAVMVEVPDGAPRWLVDSVGGYGHATSASTIPRCWPRW
ncbi:hypothetical protein B0H13DRAFT_2386673 [Mycena leptocephala]|nr:hypothetical protein B0H13DRAFT_2386673 [Mycena leptocephala]